MGLQVLIILTLILSANSIKVPVNDNDDKSTEDSVTNKADPTKTSPTYYVSDDANVDSYLIPPNPHKLEELISDVGTPPTYLLPPSQGQLDYYSPTEPGEQSDWYPIAQNGPTRNVEPIPIYQSTNSEAHYIENPRTAKEQRYTVPIPSFSLEPPLENAPNDYIVPTSSDKLTIPYGYKPVQDPDSAGYELPIEPIHRKEEPIIYGHKSEARLPLYLVPPQPYIQKQKIPTKLYPKKFSGEFKPVPIPIAQYAVDSALEIPRAKPVKLFKPLPSSEIDYLTPSDEKINYLYRKAENQRKLKGEEVRQESSAELSGENAYRNPLSTEQQTSESFRHPGLNAYPAPLRQAPQKVQKHEAIAAPAPNDRTEFRMHGMKGPHSYQFGYDTGKGKNRQFRYEERDNDGQVKGHYGYMDKSGKLRVVNYSAHPETGFKADAAVEEE